MVAKYLPFVVTIAGSIFFLCIDAHQQWISSDALNTHQAKGKACGKTFDMSSMRESAFQSDMKSTKHIDNMKATTVHSTMQSYLMTIVHKQGTEPALRTLPDVSVPCKMHTCDTVSVDLGSGNIALFLQLVTAKHGNCSRKC